MDHFHIIETDYTHHFTVDMLLLKTVRYIACLIRYRMMSLLKITVKAVFLSGFDTYEKSPGIN